MLQRRDKVTLSGILHPWIIVTLLGGLAGAMACTGDLGDLDGDGTGDDDDGGIDPLADGDVRNITLHRLNRVEYNHTVADLLGTTLTPADDFPPDDFGYGFDNIADVLSVSPTHVELYERAAENLIEEVMKVGVESNTDLFEAEDIGGTAGGANGDAWNLSSSGEVAFTHTFPVDGSYVIAARVWQDAAGPDDAQAAISVGGQTIEVVDVPNEAANPLVVEVPAEVTAGTLVVSVSFENDYYLDGLDRNLWVDWIEVTGPIGATVDNPLREQLLTCDLEAEGVSCAETVLRDFAYKAWRRPVAEDEIARLMEVVQFALSKGDTVEAGFKLAMRAILVSPHFIYRVEIDPDVSDPTPHPVGDYELASRLSYFLWSTMPDEELFALAEQGLLTDPATIESQVARMLADPRANRFVDNFVGQWLLTRSLADHHPDAATYPDYDDALRDAMGEEARLFFRDFLTNGRPLNELLRADFTYVNDRLAAHYGLAPVGSNELVRVDVPDQSRGGILTQGASLTVTSYPTATSPVKRGKFVLGRLLCSEPPPPPAGVEAELDPDVNPDATLKELLAQHRDDPSCSGCHTSMDNIGFGLERFDGTGQARDQYDNGHAVDDSGELPGIGAFSSFGEMSTLLVDDVRIGPCVTRQIMTYGLGRGLEPTDQAFVDYIHEQADIAGYTLPEVIQLIAVSDAFRMRRAMPDAPPTGGTDSEEGGEL